MQLLSKLNIYGNKMLIGFSHQIFNEMDKAMQILRKETLERIKGLANIKIVTISTAYCIILGSNQVQ